MKKKTDSLKNMLIVLTVLLAVCLSTSISNAEVPFGVGNYTPNPDSWIENGLFQSIDKASNILADDMRRQIEQKIQDDELEAAVEAAKNAALEEYNAKVAIHDEFAAAYGGQVSELSDSEIERYFSNDYFTARMESLNYFVEEAGDARLKARNALIRAQSRHNITISGKLDINTKRMLIENSDVIPVDIVPEDHPEGMWVTINKSARILTVYVDDAVYNKYPVAVGSSITLTPTGKWKFVSKAVNPRWGGGGYAEPVAGGARNNPLGKRWIGISKDGGSRYGVHGNVSPYSIGTYASHGCVRMINADVESMFEYIEIGTPVWIGTNDEFDEWGIQQTHGVDELVMPDFKQFLSAEHLALFTEDEGFYSRRALVNSSGGDGGIQQ
ncbi:MAG: L,D-transpeptidase [Oscillospiraceae bacterium]|nr:L,D-transpeptidase [Oscillospiraceae bacterium]